MTLREKIARRKCSICLQPFHDPVILNCGHTFDRLCIEQLIDTNKSSKPIKCPLCNQTFDPKKPLISNKSLAQVMNCEPTFEWFLIDVSSLEQKANALTFLKSVFNQRNIFETNRITFETAVTRMAINSETNFEHELCIGPFFHLDKILPEICEYLQEQDGRRKICILTDGSTKHTNLTRIDSNIIEQRFIIHLGDKNSIQTRNLATHINFQFGFFNSETLQDYVHHFLAFF